MAKNNSPEQETQHQKRKDATQDRPVDDSEADAGIEQETQHERRSAAQKAGRDSDED